MGFTFTPSLGETLNLSTSFVQTTQIQLRFTATLPPSSPVHDEHSKLIEDGGKLQLWSDIPTAGRPAGEWGQANFEIVQPAASSQPSGVITLSDDRIDLDPHPTFTLVLSVPSPTSLTRYAFTYRLLLPSGEVRWLGAFGNNGSLVISKGISPFNTAEGWTPSVEAGTLLWEQKDDVSEAVTVARLPIPAHWQAWGINKEGFQSPPGPCSALVFSPKTPLDSVLVQQPFALSSDSLISYGVHGEISISGKGLIALHPYDAPLDSAEPWISAVLSNASLTEQVRKWTLPGGLVLFASSKAQGSAQGWATALALPNVYKTSHLLELEVGALLSFLHTHTKQFSVFAPSTLDFDIFTPDKTERLFLNPSFVGGHFIVSAVHSVNEYLVSFPSPHTISRTGSKDSSTELPTPPPSPHLKPLAHPTRNRSREREVQQGNDIEPDETVQEPIAHGSYPSVSDIGIPSRQHTPPSAETTAEGHISEVIHAPQPVLRRPPSVTSLLSPQTPEERRGLISVTKFIILAIWVALTNLLRAIFGRRNDRKGQLLIQGSGNDDVPAAIVEERTPLLADVQQPEIALVDTPEPIHSAEVFEPRLISSTFVETTSLEEAEGAVEVPLITTENSPPPPLIETPTVPIALPTSLTIDVKRSELDGSLTIIKGHLASIKPRPLVVELNGKSLSADEIITKKQITSVDGWNLSVLSVHVPEFGTGLAEVKISVAP